MENSKNLVPQVLNSLMSKNLLWDACAVVLIGMDDHLKRAELGLRAIELVLEELPMKESTGIFSKIEELIQCTDEYIKVEAQYGGGGADTKIRAPRKVYQSHMNLEEEIKKEGFDCYPLSIDIPMRMRFLIISSKRVANVALRTHHNDSAAFEAIDAAVEYLPEKKRKKVLNKIIEHGIKMLLTEKN